MKGDWLHLTCFSFIWVLILRTFEEMCLNFSNSQGKTFVRYNSWRRSAQNDALSKWLKSLYWVILGLCFTWKVLKPLMLIYGNQKNLSHKHLTDKWKLFGWFVKMWSISVRLSGLLKQVGCLIKFLRLYDVQNSSK